MDSVGLLQIKEFVLQLYTAVRMNSDLQYDFRRSEFIRTKATYNHLTP